jgi:hypothetical protein
VPGMDATSLAVAESPVLSQRDISPAPTSVTVAVCPAPGSAVRTAAAEARSTPKDTEAKSRVIFLKPVTSP